MEGVAWGALGAFVSVVLTVSVTQYLKIREQNAKDRAAKAEQDRLTKHGETEEQRVARREARDEYRDLYVEVRQELTATRMRERGCEKRLARLEAAWIARVGPLPPIPSDDTGEHVKLEADDVPKSTK